MGLDSHAISRVTSSQSINEPQAVPAIHLDYGRTLRKQLAVRDPFYCLKELFTLVASSEKQFMNVMELKLENIISHHSERAHNDSLETLRCFNALLYRHSQLIKTTLSSIGSTSHHEWPKAEEEVTSRTRNEIQQDFMHLQDQATALCQHCQDEIAVLMNSMAILESEKAISQAERMEQLTFLAFIFVPLSFVSSFFSMNVPELQNVPIWIWFTVSAVIFVASTGFYLFKDRIRNVRELVAGKVDNIYRAILS